MPDAIKTYGVSDDVITMRLSVTAARRRIEKGSRTTVD